MGVGASVWEAKEMGREGPRGGGSRAQAESAGQEHLRALGAPPATPWCIMAFSDSS